MRDEFMKMLRRFRETDISNTPIMITTKALVAKLEEKGFSRQASCEIVTAMKIDVNESFVNDKELFDYTIETYAILMNKMLDATYDIHPNFFWQIIKNNEITLEYEG